MSTAAQVKALFEKQGSPVRFHRDESDTPCPCRTPEGDRDMEWHILHPNEPMCLPNAMLPSDAPIDISMKAFIQPIQSTRATRLQTERYLEMFGEIQADDHLGLFLPEWDGIPLDFSDWSESGEDFIEYNGRKFTVVNVNTMPDPSGGDPNHHIEVGMRLIHS